MTTRQTIDLGYRPHKFQAGIHRRLDRFAVVVAHRRFGKTVLAVMELIDRALRHKDDTGRFGYVAPYLKQSKEIAWDYLKRYTADVPNRKVNESELTVTMHNGARIRLYGADNADAMRGTYFDFVVIDEVADMKPNVWSEIIRPALADRKGGALFIGTPKGMNLLAELYHSNEPGWYRAMYRVDETGLIDEDELEMARVAMSESHYRQEFLCDFSASADNILITIDVAVASAKRALGAGVIDGSPVILGVDVARYGGDRSVIQRRQGLQAFDPIIMQGLDNMEVAGRLAAEIVEHSPDAVFVDAGRGEGVIDRVRQLGHQVMEVHFGGRPADPSYTNKRGEMWDTMRKWLDAGGAIPNHTELIQDMAAPTYSLGNAAGKFELEPKDKIKERVGRSTDLGDALALTFAAPVAKKQNPLVTASLRRRVDYDPLAAA